MKWILNQGVVLDDGRFIPMAAFDGDTDTESADETEQEAHEEELK